MKAPRISTVYVGHPDWPGTPPTPVLVRSDGYVKIPDHPAPEVALHWQPLEHFSDYVQTPIKASGALEGRGWTPARKGLPTGGFLLGLLFGLLLAKKLDPYVP